MKKRNALVALAIIAAVSVALPAVAATPSPMKLAKRALKVGKSADKRAKKAQKAAKRALGTKQKVGPRGGAGPTGAEGARGTQGAAGLQGTPGSTGATGPNGVSHAYGISTSASFLLNASSELTIGTLSGLPVGKYVIQAKIRVVNLANATRAVTCTLYDGPTSLDSETATVGSTTTADVTRVVPFLSTRDKAAVDDITLKCRLDSGSPADASAERPDIVAIAVDQLN